MPTSDIFKPRNGSDWRPLIIPRSAADRSRLRVARRGVHRYLHKDLSQLLASLLADERCDGSPIANILTEHIFGDYHL